MDTPLSATINFLIEDGRTYARLMQGEKEIARQSGATPLLALNALGGTMQTWNEAKQREVFSTTQTQSA